MSENSITITCDPNEPLYSASKSLALPRNRRGITLFIRVDAKGLSREVVEGAVETAIAGATDAVKHLTVNPQIVILDNDSPGFLDGIRRAVRKRRAPVDLTAEEEFDTNYSVEDLVPSRGDTGD